MNKQKRRYKKWKKYLSDSKLCKSEINKRAKLFSSQKQNPF